MSSNYQICTRCIMDTQIEPNITFNEHGVCNFCLNFDKKMQAINNKKHNLPLIINKIKKTGRNNEYDCIIGLSGGVDSTYVAYLTKQFGLRPLAIHFDNGWNSELSIKNIENIVKKLSIDLHTYVIDWEEFKEIQLSFIKSSQINIEIPTDHAITAILFQEASKRNIRYIISGGNVATEGMMPKSNGYDSRDLKHIKAIYKLFSGKNLKNFPRFSLLTMLYYIFIKRIKFITILDYVDFKKSYAKELIKEKLDWIDYGGKHYESIFTRFYQAYILLIKFKYDKRKPHLSSLINSHDITRDEALAELNTHPYPTQEMLNSDLEFVIKKFGLNKQQFEEFMQLPIKTYKDYPSNAWFFESNFIINLAKKIIKR